MTIITGTGEQCVRLEPIVEDRLIHSQHVQASPVGGTITRHKHSGSAPAVRTMDEVVTVAVVTAPVRLEVLLRRVQALVDVQEAATNIA
jgi:hypothetical protein